MHPKVFLCQMPFRMQPSLFLGLGTISEYAGLHTPRLDTLVLSKKLCRWLTVKLCCVVVHALQNGALCSATSFEMDKVKSILKQVVRDWSEDGEDERISCYKPVVSTITRLFPSDQWLVNIWQMTSMLMWWSLIIVLCVIAIVHE